jgi:hypothetical protein
MDNSNLTRLQRVGDRSSLRDGCWKRNVGKYTRAAEYLIAINKDIIDRLLDVISFRRPATGRIGIDGAVLECKLGQSRGERRGATSWTVTAQSSGPC